MMVCAQADTVESADAELTRQRPDLLLLDLWLGAGDTLEFIKLTRARWPQVAIVVLSQHDETLYAERALRAGKGRERTVANRHGKLPAIWDEEDRRWRARGPLVGSDAEFSQAEALTTQLFLP